MALRLLPDVELLVVTYLLGVAEVTAICGQRIGTVLYAGAGPAVQVVDITGEELVPRHLDAAHLQVDAWGGTRAQANDLARTARAALLEMPSGALAAGVVTDVATLARPRWLPDETQPINDAPRPRWSADYSVTVHPKP